MMRNYFYILLSIIVFSCKVNNPEKDVTLEVSIPKNYILSQSTSIFTKNDIVFLNNEKFDGYLYALYPNTNDTVSIEGHIGGKLHGICKKWHPNGQLQEERVYSKGEKNGKQTTYWENGLKKFEFIAKNDIYEGELREWNTEGKLIHLANYENGQEEGTQKLWYDNGKIRANYVIIKGKRYGLLGTKNCKNVSDSIFVLK